MKSLFEVHGKNRFENDKQMIVSVYGVRTSRVWRDDAEFLMFDGGRWHWMDAKLFTPINNK